MATSTESSETNEFRRIAINHARFSDSTNFCTNQIRTSKYTILTFLPKNIMEQFYGLANFYFLSLIILQQFPLFKEVDFIVTALPIIIIVSLTAFKDGVEDLKRHSSDNRVNKTRTLSLQNWRNCNFDGNIRKPEASKVFSLTSYLADLPKSTATSDESCWSECHWDEINVGDFLLLRNNEMIPADLVVISTSEDCCTCYVETKNLDGETNLKIRKGISELAHVKMPEDCSKLCGYLDVEKPSPDLFSFKGALKLTINDKESKPRTTIPIGASGILLRGCTLRNTSWVIGIVAYTGADSKIRQNSGATPSKRSKIERLLNIQVIMNTVILIAMCMFSGIGSLIYSSRLNFEQPLYVNQWSDPAFEGFVAFCRGLIFYQNIIPIALYLSFQMIKTIQSYFIYCDLDMFDEETEIQAKPNSWNLTDDLGQIEYIFSDKTGTLTSNVMDFKRASINGNIYGPSVNKSLSEEYKQNELGKMKKTLGTICSTANIDDTHGFYDSSLIELIVQKSSEGQRAIEFFTHLAICHTVLIEKPTEGSTDKKILYRAQSPDEAALVAAAKNVGFTFLNRNENKIEVDIIGEKRVYTILNVLEFNSDRKRMSVIAKKEDGSITLFCKGADSVIYERLDSSTDTDLKKRTSSHLEVFGNEGLRTLCLAYRNIDEAEYNEWVAKYNSAQASIVNREKECASVAEEIEKGMQLMGATAIEDKLQDGVPEAIDQLLKAGIKLWVLTGDKVETAINIGFSCNLLSKSMTLILIEATSHQECIAQITESLERFWDANGQPKAENAVALVIDGLTLGFALEESIQPFLLELGCRCKSVLCCRVSPLQKALVVKLVRDGIKAMCLAIGDGANDVSMIQAADIGVGIGGKEGMQAVMASDYAITKFRFLNKLLFVHGRWAYIRCSEVVLNYFYKNVMWLFILFWHQFYSQFSSAMVLDFTYSMFFNTIFTILPTIMVGIFDFDFNAKVSMKNPELYQNGIQGYLFNIERYFLYLIHAVYQSLACYFGGVYLLGSIVDIFGHTQDLVTIGTVIATSAIMVVNIFSFSNWNSWTIATVGSLTLSVASWVIYLTLYALDLKSPTSGITQLLVQPLSMAAISLIIIVCLIPRLAIKFWVLLTDPNDTDLIKECIAQDRRVADGEELEIEEVSVGQSVEHALEPLPIVKEPTRLITAKSTKSVGRLRLKSLVYMNNKVDTPNTGFAFSHEIGMADIITPRIWNFPSLALEDIAETTGGKPPDKTEKQDQAGSSKD